MVNISVLMSVYKNDDPKEVESAIQSILNQSQPPKQVVIVLDGPIPDALLSVVKEFEEDKRFDVVPLEKNVGLGKALSVGIQHCKCEYVARMDSDDYSVADRFEKQMRYLEEHQNVDVLGGQIEEYDHKMQKAIAIRSVPLTMDEIKKRCKKRNPVNHVTVVYKKDSVLRAGNYQTCMYFEDYYLWCRMLQKGFVFNNLPDVLVHVRTGTTMYQRRGGKKYNDAIIDFQNKIYKLGLINRMEWLENLVIRIGVANMPNSLRGYIYQHQLRKNDIPNEIGGARKQITNGINFPLYENDIGYWEAA